MQFRFNLDAIRCNLYGIALPSILEIGSCYFFGRGWVGGVGGCVGGLEEKWRLKLSQLPTEVEVEVEAELGKNEATSWTNLQAKDKLDFNPSLKCKCA